MIVLFPAPFGPINPTISFSNIEKRIEQDLIVLYKNNSDIQKKFKSIDTKLSELEERVRRAQGGNDE